MIILLCIMKIRSYNEEEQDIINALKNRISLEFFHNFVSREDHEMINLLDNPSTASRSGDNVKSIIEIEENSIISQPEIVEDENICSDINLEKSTKVLAILTIISVAVLCLLSAIKN